MARQDRITVEALKYYVPLFEQGVLAEDILFNNIDELSHAEIAQLQSVASLKGLVVDKIYALSGPLITRELNKILKNSPLKDSEGIFDIIYYAGKDGLEKGLKKFSVDKINVSSTNYLFQWITVYAKKELTRMETPMGIPISRYEKYKKISAVRKKMTEELERTVSNEEILEYFHSGQADIANMNGRVKNRKEPSKANKQITLQDIVEQETFETYLMNVHTYDPTSDYSANMIMADDSKNFFNESILGAFVSEHNFVDKAVVVLESEYAYRMSEEHEKILEEMEQREYRKFLRGWEKLFKDENGVFYTFLTENRDINPFFVDNYVKSLSNIEEKVESKSYAFLFNKEKS